MKSLNQSGQATTEYVLLLAITIGLIIALVAKVYSPFNKWAKSYMGAYIGCLLDTGELPTLGATGSSSASGICNAEFENFNVAGGRSPKDGSKAQEKMENEASEKSGSGSSGSGSTSAGGGGGASKMASSRGFKIGSAKGSDGPAGSGSESDDGPGGGSKTSYYRARLAGNAGLSQKRRPAVGVSGMLAKELEKEKQRSERVRAIASTTEEGGDTAKNRKFAVKQAEKKTKIEDTTTEWGMGKLIRLALIAMLVIAILLFLGGQALQISKSMEKG